MNSTRTVEFFCEVSAVLIFDPTLSEDSRQAILDAALMLNGELLFQKLYNLKQPALLFELAEKCLVDERRPISIRIIAVRSLGLIRNLSALPAMTDAVLGHNSALSAAAKRALGLLGDPMEVFASQFEFAERQAERGFRADAQRVLDRCAIFVSVMFEGPQAGRLQIQLQRLRDRIAHSAA